LEIPINISEMTFQNFFRAIKVQTMGKLIER